MNSNIIRSVIVIALLQSLASADTKSSSSSSKRGYWYGYYGTPLTVNLPSGQIVFSVQGRARAKVDLVEILINGQIWKSFKMRLGGAHRKTLTGEWEDHKIRAICQVEISYLEPVITITSCRFKIDGKDVGEVFPSTTVFPQKAADVNQMHQAAPHTQPFLLGAKPLPLQRGLMQRTT